MGARLGGAARERRQLGARPQQRGRRGRRRKRVHRDARGRVERVQLRRALALLLRRLIFLFNLLILVTTTLLSPRSNLAHPLANLLFGLALVTLYGGGRSLFYSAARHAASAPAALGARSLTRAGRRAGGLPARCRVRRGLPAARAARALGARRAARPPAGCCTGRCVRGKP